jgi:hypothetical protein
LSPACLLSAAQDPHSNSDEGAAHKARARQSVRGAVGGVGSAKGKGGRGKRVGGAVGGVGSAAGKRGSGKIAGWKAAAGTALKRQRTAGAAAAAAAAGGAGVAPKRASKERPVCSVVGEVPAKWFLKWMPKAQAAVAVDRLVRLAATPADMDVAEVMFGLTGRAEI